ncbi:OmpP1/FadL family transporter [Oceanomicrobium pacificus]|uniref:Long-chain fatty acid transport protein n=1 Tax=Oceanomicrobium pacificus TaxID=2692916 RepID=A0A6B0TNK4_9RHOB|nr:outer membrane protein transport protein [Oceanomicrobium pacificus]MXU66190.1 hypothetical protein [Oceanomicrobium pacificus]
MSKITLAATTAIVAATATSAFAGGLDRSGQSINALFEEGRYLGFGLTYVSPNVSGTDIATLNPLESDSGNIAKSYWAPSLAFKDDINDRLSYALLYDKDYGAEVDYATDGSILLGGQQADAFSQNLTGILQYNFDGGFSGYAGLRAQSVEADVTLNGAVYPFPNGYNAKFDKDWAFGYLIGAAWERPDIAARVSLTYFSKIKHDTSTTETGLAPIALEGDATIETPQSVNLDFQTGVAANTLLFGSIRWVNWSDFDVTPPNLGSALVSYDDDTFTYNLGLGYKFTEEFSGAVQASYEKGNGGTVSTLGGTDGRTSLGIGGTYTMANNTRISAGLNYSWLGDATGAVSGTEVMNYKDNYAIGAGIRVSFDLN